MNNCLLKWPEIFRLTNSKQLATLFFMALSSVCRSQSECSQTAALDLDTKPGFLVLIHQHIHIHILLIP